MTTAWPRAYPLPVFNFDVGFTDITLRPGGETTGPEVRLCGGAFSELTDLEATMEPKVIKEGGRNFGVVQRVGPVTFATVVLKRGVSQITDLWKWFELVAGGASAKRLNATITVYDPKREPVCRWRLLRALPTKFKTADLNASSSSVAVEELHIAHEGLTFEPATGGGGAP